MWEMSEKSQLFGTDNLSLKKKFCVKTIGSTKKKQQQQYSKRKVSKDGAQRAWLNSVKLQIGKDTHITIFSKLV